MKAGDGDSRYAKASSSQLNAIQAMKPILERAICENMRLKSNVGGIFRIADFVCGFGNSTLVVVVTIVSAVKRSFEEHEMPEFELEGLILQRLCVDHISDVYSHGKACISVTLLLVYIGFHG
ncbi:hypothetical protein SUGI_0554330 [Cryptomeria japonica]|nr:hypothetical protein SUGI_0554330 [Cryptomeria japonica]